MNWFRRFLLSLVGKTNTLKADEFPAGLADECHEARAEAVKWYRRKYGREPVIRPVRVVIEGKPRNGMAGWTIGCNGGFEIHLSERHIEYAIHHEFRHTMPGCVDERAVV